MKEKEWCEYSGMPSPYHYMDTDDWDTISPPPDETTTVED